VAAVLSTNAIDLSIDRDRDGAPVVTMRGDDEARVQKAREALEELPPEIREQLQIDPDELLAQPPPEQDQEKAWFKVSDIQLNGQPWDRETNPVDIRWLPDWVNRRLNDEIEKSPDKAREINRNPNLIVEQVFDILPATMFILLPAVALLFKFWYLFARRYYIEHLIFALHNHSFLFVSLLLILGLSLLAGWLETSGALLAAQAASWLLIAISVWIPLYLLISLRHVYRQNWFLTLFKFGVIGISYITLLGIVTSIVALLGFVLL